LVGVKKNPSTLKTIRYTAGFSEVNALSGLKLNVIKGLDRATEKEYDQPVPQGEEKALAYYEHLESKSAFLITT